MILQELCAYYDRLAADPSHTNDVAHKGWSPERVAWELVIDEGGNCLGLYSLADEKKKPREMMVPEHTVRTSGLKPFFLCDKALYLLGIGEKNGKAARECSYEMHERILSESDDHGARAVLAFFEQDDPGAALSERQREELASGAMIVLSLEGRGRYIHERPAVKRPWEKGRQDEGDDGKKLGCCAVTGQKGQIASLFPLVSGVPGAQSSGASLVSFNFDASESYGKKKTLNASISEDAAFRAGAALKYLLGNRDRRIVLGNTVVTFWTDAPTSLEDEFFAAIMKMSGGTAAEDEGTRQSLENAFEEIKHGEKLTELDANVGYCILGVSPNAARLSVRFFERGMLGELAERYGRYLRDIEMVDVRRLSLWQVLLQTASLGDEKNIPSTLITRTFEAMIGGGAFPRSLESMVLSRMRADHGFSGKFDVAGQRAAILKACLVRRLRLAGVVQGNHNKIGVKLNMENDNVGYALGRMFAVFERAQQEAVKNANATIRDRYYGAASSTPARVIPVLQRGYAAHLAAIRKDSSKKWLVARLEEELRQIMGDCLKDRRSFPNVLSVDEQNAFLIGYYQESRYLWKSKKSDKSEAVDKGEE